MLKNKLLAAMGGEATDPDFENVTLLLHGDGTNGGQNNTFVDGSTNNFTITRNGNTTQGSFSPYGDLWSNYFDGTGDYLVPTSSSIVDFGTGDFTIEMFVNLSALGSTRCLLDGRSAASDNRILLLIGTDNKLYFGTVVSGSVVNFVTSTSVFSVGQWVHVAVTRSGTSLRLFFNGALEASATNSTNFASGTDRPTIGATGYIVGNDVLLGYISNLRIVKGTAVYTSNFTPPTAPLTAITNTSLLTCQSNRFIDNSSNAFAITRNGDVSVQRFSPFAPSAAYSTATIGGSGYFDGTGDWLSSSGVNIGANDVTIEFWFYATDGTVKYRGLYDSRSAIATNTGFGIFQYGRVIQIYGNGLKGSTASNAFNANEWVHFAVVRNSGVCQIYINGVASGSSFTYSNSLTSTVRYIGNSVDTVVGEISIGYLSNVREVTSAVYTSNFTPSTTPLTAITNTSLLLNFTNASIFDNAMMADLETVGNAQISTSVKKYGTGSLAFDGSGDYLFGPLTPNLDLGSGDFTIEMWVYFSSLPTSTAEAFFVYGGSGVARYGLIYDRRVGQPQGLRFTALNSSNALVIDVAQGGSSGWSSTTWYHVAVTRSGNSFRLFRDGVQIGSTVTDTDAVPAVTSGGIHVAIDSDKSSIPFDGYIDDLRITKGVARYTANFTAPTAPFSNK